MGATIQTYAQNVSKMPKPVLERRTEETEMKRTILFAAAALALAGCASQPNYLAQAANQVGWERMACQKSGSANSSACAIYQHDSDNLDEALMIGIAMNGGGGYVAPAPAVPSVGRTHCWSSGDTFDCNSY